MLEIWNPVIWAFVLSYVLALACCLMAFCSDGSKHFNGIPKEDDSSFLGKFFNRLYFSTVSMSTLGYGDITPKSPVARLVVMAFLAIPLFLIFRTITRTVACPLVHRH
jgi:hypothetical protein